MDHARTLRIQTAKAVPTICPYCAVGCGMIAHTVDGRIVNIGNTMALSGTTFRHVKFVEDFDLANPNRVGGRWLMMSDVCKHCVQAGCLEVCPTGAIVRAEFDTVFIQDDVCNGCRYCVAGCPFGVIEMNEPVGE